ncbi:hypothetical protein RclHR1_08710006 [Rhizophagus clarus]|uniref:S8 family peptidase n=1 Tax=Rhizophagus clarus TaxID=94130 RepID=A0A2Z6S225_9GLOM|nr:hypothetical protein RclHR1_08710006 [Rhizophagus clarus]GES93870.1 S8 family peptidase [Rhizophagus clarus]
MFRKIFFLTIVFAVFYIVVTRPELPQSETSPFNKPAAKRYIIMFQPETSEEIMNDIKSEIVNHGGTIYQEYFIIKGIAAEIPESSESFVQTLKTNPNIKSMEEDQLVHTMK